MPKIHLTDISLKALKGLKQETYWDTVLPAFGVRVGKNRKTFTVMVGNNRRRVSIGLYPDLSLKDAREKAKKLLAKEADNGDEEIVPTFDEALATFFATHCDQKQRASTARETKRLLNKHHLPKFQNKKLDEIKPSNIQSIIDRLLETPGEAVHAFRAIRLFFRWARSRNYIKNSPCEGMVPPSQAKPRERFVSDEELKVIWGASDFYPFGTIVRLLILTGQRRSEIGSLKWSYIDPVGRTISLPPEVSKNGRRHTFPYGPAVHALLESIPRESEYLFPSRDGDDRPFSGYSPSKVHFDKKAKCAHWTLHDLRRTFATNLAALNAPIHVTEKLLNHVSGTVSGVAAIYNRYSYMDEMRAALKWWETRLSFIVGEPVDGLAGAVPPPQ